MKQIVTILLLSLLLTACDRGLTQEKFDDIKQGMSMKQVVAIIGEPTSSESINIAGISGTSATWKTKDAAIAIQFLNNQVTIKIFNKAHDLNGEEVIKPDTH